MMKIPTYTTSQKFAHISFVIVSTIYSKIIQINKHKWKYGIYVVTKNID